jgi:hypothetical protein
MKSNFIQISLFERSLSPMVTVNIQLLNNGMAANSAISVFLVVKVCFQICSLVFQVTYRTDGRLYSFQSFFIFPFYSPLFTFFFLVLDCLFSFFQFGFLSPFVFSLLFRPCLSLFFGSCGFISSLPQLAQD